VKIKNLITKIVLLNLLFVSTVFGQGMSAELVNPGEADIFPFAPEEERTVEYTEDLFEITDQGVFDGEGRWVNSVSEIETPLLSPEEEAVVVIDEEDLIPIAENQSAFEAYRDSIISNWGGKKAFTEERLRGIRENLETEKQNWESLGSKIEEYEVQLEPIHKEIETIKEQIDLLNAQLVKTKDKIKNAEFLIAEKQLRIKELMKEIQYQSVELDMQQGIVLEYILLVYQEDERFLDLYSEGSSTLKLLLTDNSVSENLLGRQYVEILEQTGREVFYDLHDTSRLSWKSSIRNSTVSGAF